MSGPGGSRQEPTLTVHVRYLSALREKTGKRPDDVAFAPGSTLADMAQWLRRTYGLEVPGPDVMSTLNGHGWSQVPRGLAAALREGDEVALVPLLSGG